MPGSTAPSTGSTARARRATTAWVRSYKSIDTTLWGRKTCDMALDFQKKGVPGTAFDTRVKNYVFTRTLPQSPAPAGVEFVTEPIKAFATRLRGEKGETHLDHGRRWHHCVVS